MSPTLASAPAPEIDGPALAPWSAPRTPAPGTSSSSSGRSHTTIAVRARARNARNASRSSCERAERRVVVELDVREHARSPRPGISIERSDSSASTTSHTTARARPPRVGHPLPPAPPTSQSGSQSGGAQRMHDHRAGGRLAVRAGHRDRAPQRGQLGQQLGARSARPARARGPPCARGYRAGRRWSRRPRQPSPSGTFTAL